ncbi:2-keto-4-pentenoate hydratase [Lentibacillus salicampi]|nr:2-keto-4-pentenoate hydratase [Lentibacillus salicampi]
MTSPDTQAYANTDEPAYGTFTEGNLVQSQDTVSLDTLFDPLIETELVFILTDDLSMSATEDEILFKSKVAAGLEIPDSRYKDWFPNFTLEDLLCDNGAAGLVVISDAVVPPSFEQLGDIHMALYHQDEKIGEGISSNVLDNPASSVAWLSGKLKSHGKSLKKGMIIASGTFIPPLRVKEGTYQATFTGIGDVSVTFSR